jgi:hypothetical protein
MNSNLNHTTSIEALHVKLSANQALHAIDKYKRDHLLDTCIAIWDDMGIRWINDPNEGEYLKFKIISKEKFLYVVFKYDLPIEIIDNL